VGNLSERIGRSVDFSTLWRVGLSGIVGLSAGAVLGRSLLARYPVRIQVLGGALIALATAALAAWLWARVVTPRWKELPRRAGSLCLAGSLFAGMLLAAAVPLRPPHHVVFVLLAGLCGGLAIFVLSLWLITREADYDPRRARRLAWLGYAAPSLLAGAFYLRIFWPALMSNDSLAQWREVLLGQFSDVAPAFHTMTNWLIARIWLSPTAVAITQLLALSLAAAWALGRMRRHGMSRAAAVVTCLVFALLPATGILAITLWKDIPYSIAMLVLTIFVMEMIHSGGAWLAGRASWVLLGVVLALVALYRHNGMPVGLGTPVVLALVYRSQWRRLALALGLTIVLVMAVRGPLYRAAGMQAAGAQAHDYFLAMVLAQHAAAHTVAATPLTEDEADFLNRLHPLENGEWRYNPYRTQMDGDISQAWPQWQPHMGELTRLVLRLSLQRPLVTLRHLLLSSSYIWGITGPGDPTYYTVAFDSARPVRYQVIVEERPDPQFSVEWRQCRHRLPRWVVKTFGRDWIWLFWRPAVYLYLLLFAVVIAMARSRSWRYGPLLVPLGLHTCFLALVVLSQEFRFQYAVYLVSVLYSGYLLFCIPRARGANSS
jgi:hypothetical protein